MKCVSAVIVLSFAVLNFLEHLRRYAGEYPFVNHFILHPTVYLKDLCLKLLDCVDER